MGATKFLGAKAVFAVVGLLLTLAPSISTTVQAQQSCIWTIGIMGALSGDYALVGKPTANGVRLAVTQRNAKGDLACRLAIHVEDSQGDPNQAPYSAQRLVDDETLIACVCGFFSRETEVAGHLFSDAGIAMLSTGDDRGLRNQGFTTWFRAVAADGAQADATALYIERHLDGQKVAVVHDNQRYSRFMAKRVAEGLGSRFDGPMYVVNPEEIDYSAVVTQLKQQRPDVVFYGGYAPQAWALVRQMRQANVDATFVSDTGAHSPLVGPRYLSSHTRRVRLSSNVVDSRRVATAQEFVADYETVYGDRPRYFSPDTYDVTNLVTDALLELTGSEPVEAVRTHVVAYLDSLEDAQGSVKTYEWDESGELIADDSHVWLWKWAAGRFVMVGRISELAD